MSQKNPDDFRVLDDFLNAEELSPPPSSSLTPTFSFDASRHQTLLDKLIEQLKTVFDPEIPVNIYDLGLIYHIEIGPDADVVVQMTLTSPGCPVAQTFPATVESTLTQLPEVNSAMVVLVWDPPWTKDRMSELAKLQLGWL